ncbi:MAG: FecR family protein [Verrucomicrobiota bacterium]|jgi:hypothetical protein
MNPRKNPSTGNQFLHPLFLAVRKLVGSSTLPAIVVATLFGVTAAADVNKAVARAVRGTAEYSLAPDEWRSARVNQIYRPGTLLRTGQNSIADLYLAENGPVVRLTPNTVLKLAKLDLVRDKNTATISTVLEVQQGRILGNVKKLSADSTYEIITPHERIVIRGTEYAADASGSVFVMTGEVQVGTDHRVKSGQAYDAQLKAVRPMKAEEQATLETGFQELNLATKPEIIVCLPRPPKGPIFPVGGNSFAADPSSPFAAVAVRRKF